MFAKGGFKFTVPVQNCRCAKIFSMVWTRLLDAILSNQGSTSPRSKASDPQVGTSEMKTAAFTLSTTQLRHDVIIADDMKASVAAMVLSSDGSFAVLPQNVLVGKVKGKEKVVCQGNKNDDAKARVCYPYAQFDLKKGDKIDFTWGLTNGQEGMLTYAIWPSS